VSYQPNFDLILKCVIPPPVGGGVLSVTVSNPEPFIVGTQSLPADVSFQVVSGTVDVAFPIAITNNNPDIAQCSALSATVIPTDFSGPVTAPLAYTMTYWCTGISQGSFTGAINFYADGAQVYNFAGTVISPTAVP
jgi:hypothetical protein